MANSYKGFTQELNGVQVEKSAGMMAKILTRRNFPNFPFCYTDSAVKLVDHPAWREGSFTEALGWATSDPVFASPRGATPGLRCGR